MPDTITPALDAVFGKRAKPLARFEATRLSIGVYAQGFTMWVYQAPHAALDTIMAPGFFDEGRARRNTAFPQERVIGIEPGDMIVVTARDAGATLFVQREAGVTRVSVARVAEVV